MNSRYTLHPVHTEADYRAALKKVEAFFDAPSEPDPESQEGIFFEALITLIEAYEAKHFPIAPPDPIGAIRFRMEQAGLTVKDLVPYIGPLNRVYEVLSGKRSLSLNMIRRLSEGLDIPAEVLIKESETVPA
jgi:HTH-type transcriptional regulator / antitoxin HigA